MNFISQNIVCNELEMTLLNHGYFNLINNAFDYLCDENNRRCVNDFAYHGLLQYLHIAHLHGVDLDKSCEYAAMGDNLECLQYAHDNNAQIGQYIMYMAINFKSYDCIKYGLINKFPYESIEDVRQYLFDSKIQALFDEF